MIDQYIQQLQAEKASSLKQCWQVFDVSHWGDYAANHRAKQAKLICKTSIQLKSPFKVIVDHFLLENILKSKYMR